jgi:hypothetical protein
MKMSLFLALVSFTILSCKEESVQPIVDGEYAGKFYYGSMFAGTQEAAANVRIEKGRYTSAGNSNHIPAGGSGKVGRVDDNTLLFSDENAWTANFDWNLILDGKYSFEVKGDSLFLDKEFDGNGGFNPPVLRYRLKRLK